MEAPSLSPPMVSAQSHTVTLISDSALETHHKIQSQFVEPFARKMDGKMKQIEATSPVGRLGAFRFEPIQSRKPPMRSGAQSVQSLPLRASHSAQPPVISLDPAPAQSQKKKLRSFTSFQSAAAAPPKRHSVGSPLDLAMANLNGQHMLSHHDALNETLQNLKAMSKRERDGISSISSSSNMVPPADAQPDRLLFTRIDAPPTIDQGSEPETDPEPEPEPRTDPELELEPEVDTEPEPEETSISKIAVDSEKESESKRVLFAQIPADNDSEDGDHSDLDIDEVAEIRRRRRQNGSMRVRISSPGSVLEEVMADKANRQILMMDVLEVGRCSEDSLAPTDDEPIPDEPDRADSAHKVEVHSMAHSLSLSLSLVWRCIFGNDAMFRDPKWLNFGNAVCSVF